MSNYLIKFASSIFLIIHIANSNCCGTQTLKNLPDLPPKVEITDEARRILDSTSYHPIRLYFDFSLLPADLSNTNREYLIQIFSVVENFFTSFLQVKTSTDYSIDLSILSSAAAGKCYEAQVPTNQLTNGISGYDFALYVTVEQNYDAEYIAWSALCVADASVTGLNRPIASQVNLAYFNEEWMTSGKYDKLISTLIHEITHSLVFDIQLWSRFVGLSISDVMVEGTWRGSKRVIINTPKVREFSQEHFGCTSFPGGELENEGEESSRWTHWERRVYGNEIMTSSYYENCVYSKITMGLMEDSGWYQVDYTKAEIFTFAKDAGCNFLGESNPTGYDEYICYEQDSNALSCYYDSTKIAKCYNDPFNDGLYGYLSTTNGECRLFYNQRTSNLYPVVYEENSRCFMSNVLRADKSSFIGDKVPTCLQSQCNRGLIQITLGEDLVTCPEQGGVLNVNTSNFIGDIICPSASTFCDLAFTSQNCPNLCSGHGACIGNGKCSCYSGFTGSDCSTEFCKNNCVDVDGTAHGTCNQNTGRCDCESGWGGEICNIPLLEFFCERCNYTRDCYGNDCVCKSLNGRECSSDILSLSIFGLLFLFVYLHSFQ